MSRHPAAALLPLLLAFSPSILNAQAAPQQPPLRSTPVLSQALQDAAFEGIVLNSSVLELAPGARVAEAHRHDAELFGFVLEGAVLTALEDGPIQRYDAGEMFYERRNILHSHFENASAEISARVLILMLAPPPADR